MTTLREAAQQALEVEADRRRKALAAEMRAALAQQAEPVEPVAWMFTDAYNPRVRFLEWTQKAKGYRGEWIKTPLYTAPPQQAEPVALKHRHEWFSTGGMEPGQFRCIHCGVWAKE